MAFWKCGDSFCMRGSTFSVGEHAAAEQPSVYKCTGKQPKGYLLNVNMSCGEIYH